MHFIGEGEHLELGIGVPPSPLPACKFAVNSLALTTISSHMHWQSAVTKISTLPNPTTRRGTLHTMESSMEFFPIKQLTFAR